MSLFLWLALLILPLPASAQLQLFLHENGTNIPVVSPLNLGSTAPGDVIEKRFRIVNNSASATTLTALRLSGEGYAMFNDPVLPRTIAANGFAEFWVRFQPTRTGVFQASLLVNSLAVQLVGAGAGLPVLEQNQGGTWTAIATNAVIEFGSVERQSSINASFRLRNATSGAITVMPPSISPDGGDFRLVSPFGSAQQVGPGGQVTFEVVFRSETAGEKTAILTLDSRPFRLRATAREFPLPRGILVFEQSAPKNASQEKVAIRLAEAARTSGSGTLRLAFTPDTGLPDDPAVGFMPSATRSIPFQVRPGSDMVEFETGSQATFQTGTVAGRITFTLLLGSQNEQFSLDFAPTTIQLDSAVAVLGVGGVEVRLRGFDNTLSGSHITFRFFLKNGQEAAPGLIGAPLDDMFKAYYAQNPRVGGVFQLRASFPATGALSELDGVEVEITNRQGVAKTGRLKF